MSEPQLHLNLDPHNTRIVDAVLEYARRNNENVNVFELSETSADVVIKDLVKEFPTKTILVKLESVETEKIHKFVALGAKMFSFIGESTDRRKFPKIDGVTYVADLTHIDKWNKLSTAQGYCDKKCGINTFNIELRSQDNIKDVLSRIKMINAEHLVLSVSGNVSLDNIQAVVNSGVGRIVVCEPESKTIAVFNENNEKMDANSSDYKYLLEKLNSEKLRGKILYNLCESLKAGSLSGDVVTTLQKKIESSNTDWITKLHITEIIETIYRFAEEFERADQSNSMFETNKLIINELKASCAKLKGERDKMVRENFILNARAERERSEWVKNVKKSSGIESKAMKMAASSFFGLRHITA